MTTPKLIHHVTTEVRSVHRETDRVTLYELADPDDWELPPFTAGAHVDIRSREGLVRQYSLLGDPAERRRYWIAIQREDDGRGGSIAFHRQLEPGSIVPLSLPRNHFPLATDARHHIFVAGGIGITPILSMVQALNRVGASYEVHFAARHGDRMPFRAMLAERAGDRCQFYFTEGPETRPLDLKPLLSAARDADVHAYCCGPAGMVDAATRLTADWQPGRFHSELFGAPAPMAQDSAAYRVELARSSKSLVVGANQTMLEAIRLAGVDIPSSCEAGVCLLCKTPYLSGTPVHRDLIMSADDRRRFVTPCVSGCSGGTLVLDL